MDKCHLCNGKKCDICTRKITTIEPFVKKPGEIKIPPMPKSVKPPKNDCKYCSSYGIQKDPKYSDCYYIHHPFVLRNDNLGKRIKNDGSNPNCYYKEYYRTKTPLWELVMEFENDNKTIVSMPAHYCLWCGEKLIGKRSVMEEPINWGV